MMRFMMFATSASSVVPVASVPDFNEFIEGCCARDVHKTRTAVCTAAAICGAVLPALRKRPRTPKRTDKLRSQAWNLINKRQFLSSSKTAIVSACFRNSRSPSWILSAMHHSIDVVFRKDLLPFVALRPKAASFHAALNSEAGGASMG